MNYIFGYGSLMSAYSRQHYSGIQSKVVTATISGWRRAWCTSYLDEGATYAGALRDKYQELDGVLIPSDIDESLKRRERGYQFSPLNLEELSLNRSADDLTADDQVWICETLVADVATTLTPLPQSYVDTCISGCLESQGVEGAKRFIKQTTGWDGVWVNDRNAESKPIYPRYTPISKYQGRLIDSLLEQYDVLKFRAG